MTAIVTRASVARDFGDGGLSVDGRMDKVEIPEVKLQSNKESEVADWELAMKPGRMLLRSLPTVA